MKKMLTLLLALVMSVSLVACGGPDRQPAIDAFNNASAAFDEVANIINQDAGAYDAELIDAMIQMSDVLSQHKALLEGDQELTEEKLNEMMEWYGDVEDWVASVRADYGI